MFRGDAAHQGVYRADGPRAFHRVKWTLPTGDRIVSSPVFSDGTIFFGSDDGNVYAVDAASGALNWKFRTGDVVHASPAYADGVVYFGSWDSYFYAVDRRLDGLRRRPQRHAGGARPRKRRAAMGIPDGGVETQRGLGALGRPPLQLTAPLGSSWREAPIVATALQFGVGSIFSSPLVVGGTVYFGSTDGNLYAIE